MRELSGSMTLLCGVHRREARLAAIRTADRASGSKVLTRRQTTRGVGSPLLCFQDAEPSKGESLPYKRAYGEPVRDSAEQVHRPESSDHEDEQ